MQTNNYDNLVEGISNEDMFSTFLLNKYKEEFYLD